MRKSFIKATSISLASLFSLIAFLISDGFAKNYRYDRSDSPFSRRTNKVKEYVGTRARQRALPKNNQERNSFNQKRQLPGRQEGNPFINKNAASNPSQNQTGKWEGPHHTLLVKSQGNPEDIKRMKKSSIAVSDITPFQRARLNSIAGKIMPPQTQIVTYGFSTLKTANFALFERLMQRRPKDAIFLLAYLS